MLTPHALALAVAAAAPQTADARLAALERELAAQRDRIAELERQLAARQEPSRTQPEAAPSIAAVAAASSSPAAPPVPRPVAQPVLAVSGDLRVREEWNRGAGRDRARAVLRARLRATYRGPSGFSAGAQLATGDPDDPNSADVTLGNFADDLMVSLDQAWIRYQHGGVAISAGKFPLPFARTDMVWDGDVSPQGLGATLSMPLAGLRTDARLLWFAVDESAGGRDSDMLGGQLSLATPADAPVTARLAGSYYHYRLNSVAGADAGDFRGNLVSGGRYRSQFHLAELLATVEYRGLGDRWPVSLTGDVVRNFGATVPGDSGIYAELAAGRAARAGDWRMAYQFGRVEVDAVLAAFSHDNIDLSTNYLLHGLVLSHIPRSGLAVELDWYRYRPLDPAYTTGSLAWRDRVRLNLMVSF
ncbi:putative porin [Sphingomonas sp.]|uniref:putative porin n=1 Tax=Sphingomonas sp. TaxID=28214 RepID=UPI001EC27C6E|nr:putative porin [Sphingomonas sp.]MBX3594612.1 putative porin [Sphingomonas sp.]